MGNGSFFAERPAVGSVRTESRDAADAGALILLVLGGLAVAWWTGWPWFVTNFLVLGAPLAYLLAQPRVRRRLDPKFTLLFVLFGTAAFDSLARRTDAWGGDSLFPSLPGGVSVEELQWILFYFPLTLALNERFFAGDDFGPPRRWVKPLLKGGFYIGLVLVILPTTREWLGSYAYAKIGSILYLPAFALALAVVPDIWRQLVAIGLVTGVLNLLFEIVALEHGYWTFPGHYLGWVEVAGYPFPVEELFFLIFWSGPSLVATYALVKNWRQRAGGKGA
jgi:hypothetical protein